MIQKMFFFIAAAAAAFALVVLGGVLAQVTPAAGNAGVAAIQTQFTQREAAYQRVVQQANTQLQQAYAKQQTLQQQLADTQQQAAAAQQQLANTQSQPAAGSAGQAAFTPDQAGLIALQLVPGARLRQQPQLVDLNGTTAYEVILDRGTLYLDAATIRVLAAVPATQGSGGAAPQPRTEQDDDNGN